MPQALAAGHALEYQWIDGAQPTLVFLHEGLGSIRQWRDFPAQVARATGCRALVYDRYGYGNSEVLREAKAGLQFMHDGALKELPDLLAKLKVDNPVLVGHSDGASIALIHAGAGYPVRGVAVLAPHVFVEPICVTSIVEARAQFESSDLPQRLGRYHRDAGKTFHLWADAWLDPDFPDWNIEQYLPGIRCPVLAIQGEGDQYGTMAQLDAIARQVGGPCELVKLPDCGHSPHKDRPAEVLNSLSTFITRLIGTNP
jgi:pimeloyl-ACP methyl ester carboxylesterase